MARYYSEENFKHLPKYKDIDFKLNVSDTYSESKIEEAIKKTGQAELLQVAALQMAIVGTGNKTYGTVTYKEEEFQLDKVLPRLGVKTELGQRAKLEPDDLTPRRLQRYFRHCIKEYLDENSESESYLYRKYSDHDTKFRSICFPGGEHLVGTREEGVYMLQTYINLDRQSASTITDRIQRVLIARNIMKLKDTRDIIALITKEDPKEDLPITKENPNKQDN